MTDKLVMIKDIKYPYFFGDILDLVDLCRNDKELRQSLEKGIADLRGHPFDVLDFVSETLSSKKYFSAETRFLLVMDPENPARVIATSRIGYSNEKSAGYVSAVYTDPEFRGRGICQGNVSKLIELTDKAINIIQLEVDDSNKAAIRCYEKIGFHHHKTDGKYYVMNLTRHS